MSPITEGQYEVGRRTVTGAPSAGTNAVQTLTIGGTPTGGNFQVAFEGRTSAAIPWNSTNATLLASINSALDAAFGASNIVASAGTLTAGIGTVLLTFGADYARRAVSLMTIAQNNLTGTSPTLAIASTTAGVDATHRGAPLGALLIRDNGTLYVNTGTAAAPTWTVVGTQT